LDRNLEAAVAAAAEEEVVEENFGGAAAGLVGASSRYASERERER